MHYGTISQYGDIKKSLRWFGGEYKVCVGYIAYMKIQTEKERRKGMRREGGKKRREGKKGKFRRGVKGAGLNLVLR